MPTSCVITFERPNGIYYSGETLNGEIRLQTMKTKSIRGVYIKINGFAHVQWKETRTRTRNGKSQTYTVTYYAHEQYLHKVTYIFGSSDGPSFDLAPGIYTRTFSCDLPLDLPTTLSANYGNVQYEVKVNIDRKFNFDQAFRQTFIVNHTLDLNSSPEYRLPKSVDEVDTFCCCCCCFGGNGDVMALLKIPCCAYVPGQKIPFDLVIKNGSNSEIEGSKVKIEKCYVFESHTPSRRYKSIKSDLDTMRFGQVLRYSTKEFRGFLQLPTMLECTQENKIITLTYKICGKVYMGCCTSNMNPTIAITIGSVPFVNIPQPFIDVMTVITQQPTAPLVGCIVVRPPAANIDNNQTEGLPTYENALDSKNNLDNRVELNRSESEDPNLPKYPVVVPLAHHDSQLIHDSSLNLSEFGAEGVEFEGDHSSVLPMVSTFESSLNLSDDYESDDEKNNSKRLTKRFPGRIVSVSSVPTAPPQENNDTGNYSNEASSSSTTYGWR